MRAHVPEMPDSSPGRGPTRLLLSGLLVVGVGFLTLAGGFVGAFSQWKNGEDPSRIYDLIQLAGLLSIACGAFMVAVSLAWWVWRIAQMIWRNTPD